MNWSLKVNCKKPTYAIDYSNKVVALGSCFSDEMANKMKNAEMQIYSNPFGITYHPIMIFNQLCYALENKIYETNLLDKDGIWFSWDYHSQIWGKNKNEIFDKIKQNNISLKNQIQNADFLILTFGSSWIYNLKESSQYVANCHKLPGDYFIKSCVDSSEIFNVFENFISVLNQFNPNLQIIFTISPVRHFRDGFYENNLSKSQLFVFVQKALEKFPNTCHYFESYEILMDELRDYRFYNNDYIHPNQLAIDYIWEQFLLTSFTKDAKSIIENISNIKRDASHRVMHAASNAFKKKCQLNLSLIEEFRNKYKWQSWEFEITQFKSIINE